MPELNTVAAEFVAVTSYCIKEQIGYYIKDNSFLAIDRAVLEELLDRNKYETSAEKLARWKRLHWIDVDERQITKSVYIKGENKRKRLIVVDLVVYGELSKICSLQQF